MALFQELQKQKERQTTVEAAPIPRRTRVDGGEYPLSFAQQRLFFLNQYEPDSAEYNIPHGFLMSGPLNPDVLRQAFDGVVARHETLRTTFKIVDGAPVQTIAESGSVAMPFVDLRGRGGTPEERMAEARRLATEDAGKPFDLARGPLLRAKLFRTGDEEHLLYLDVHHIAWDGWSQGIFLSELRALYDAFLAEDPSPLPDPPVQYLDFGLWQREWLQGEILERQLSYWVKQLGGVPPLELPCDRPRPAVRTHAGTTAPIFLSRELAGALRRLAQQEGATPFMLYCAAYRALLHHYSAQEDFAIGTLIANRRRPEIEVLVGFFANTLALRTDLPGDPAFREMLRRERATALDAYSHQDLPFEKLVEELNPPRDLSRTPIFQTMLVLQNAPPPREEAREEGRAGLSMRLVPVDSRTSKFDCMLYLTEGDEGVRGFLEYNTDLFEPATVTRLLGHFRALLEGVAADPDLHLSGLPLLPADERRTMLVDWNATAVDIPAGETLHGLFERQAAERPGAVAVEMDGRGLTYAELDARANRLARHLRRLGAGPEVLVGLCMERSLEMLVGLLGILKAGGAYVPLDPEYPKERLAYMVESSCLPVLLTQESLVATVPAGDARVIALDQAWPRIEAEESADGLDGSAGPDSLAYAIYTSGSTGRPKGVQIPHSAVVNFLRSMTKRPGLGAGDTLFAVTTLSFDIAGLELYLPLVNGAKVVLVSRDTAQAGEQLAAAVTKAGTTVMQATPATWRLLLAAGWTGDPRLKILCGGEALPHDLADQILDKAGELWNVYGPTEATIWSTLLQVERGSRISIGRPIDNTQVYLMTRQLEPVPAGVPGELHIGGAGLSRGYRGRPAMTAERFIPDAFSSRPGARLYRTGDLARWLPDGTLEFLGRIDHQVKVRGFRIELGEIEAALAQHPAIRQDVAIVREDTPGARRIVAYMVPAEKDTAPSVSDLRAFLKEKLPEYMIPALFVPLEALPLTPNGKVDRRALPAPDKSLLASAREYVAPRDEKEEALAAIWAEVLGLEKVGALDDFFELGGDSLLVIKVVSKANKSGLGITTKQLFQNRTVAELAAVAGTSTILAEQGAVTGPIRFTPAQRHFLEFDHPNPSWHSLGNLLRPRDRKLNRKALRRALLAVVNHHDSLRARIVHLEGGGWQLVLDEPVTEVHFQELDISQVPQEQHSPVMSAAAVQLLKAQSMAEGGLVKLLVFEAGAEEGASFYLNIHFMAADIGSWAILLDDLDTAYQQLCAGQPVKLQPKTTSVRQWADRLAERAAAMPEDERTYWLERQVRPEPLLPRDFPEGTNYWDSVRQTHFDMTEEESRLLLQEVPRAYGVQIDGILMTSILLAFERWTGQRSMGFQAVGHGKEPLWDDIDLTRTVGWFNIIFPGAVDLGESKTPIESLRVVNQQLRRIPNGGLGYGILRYLSDDPTVVERMARPFPEVFFNYLGPDVASEIKTFEKIVAFHGYPQDRRTRRLATFMIHTHVVNGILIVKWDYSKNLHRPETVERLCQTAQEILRDFLADYQARRRKAA